MDIEEEIMYYSKITTYTVHHESMGAPLIHKRERWKFLLGIVDFVKEYTTERDEESDDDVEEKEQSTDEPNGELSHFKVRTEE